jgi:hypothetical protein
MEEIMDYTKKRKSKEIQVCPKCGRKGLFSRGLINEGRANAKKYHIIKHVTSIVTIAGMAFESVKEHCTVEVQQ